MAQYKNNFYSSSLYGRIKAAYGEYYTEVFDGQEPFSARINTTLMAELHHTYYTATSGVFEAIDRNLWKTRGTDLYTTTPNSPFEVTITGDHIELHVRQQKQGTQIIEATLYREELVNGAYQWVHKQSLSTDTLSVTNAGKTKAICFDSFGFGEYKLSVKATETGAEAIVAGINARTSGLSILVRTSANKTNWSDWELVSLDCVLEPGSNLLYKCIGQSTKKANIRYVQGKIILLSSDSQSSPVVERVELRSDDSELHDEDGEYIVWIDMQQVATKAGKTFKSVDTIKWEEKIPVGTEMNIRSSSSERNITWDPISAPYRKNTRRIRLNSESTKGTITVGLINEGSQFNQYTKVVEMLNWDTQAYLAKDGTNTSITFTFTSDNKKLTDSNTLLKVEPLKTSNRSAKFKNNKVCPYYLRVQLSRDKTQRGTPVVDWINIDQMIQYKETAHIVNQNASAVDGLGTGVKSLNTIKKLHTFDSPSGNNHSSFNKEQINKAKQTWELTDKTGKPSEIMLYLKSEKDAAARTNIAHNDSDEVMVKAIARREELGEETGLRMHYQYGAGKVQYLRDYTRELDSTFTPSLLEDRRYRYLLKNGWPTEKHTVKSGQTIEDVAEMYEVSMEELLKWNSDIVYNEDGSLAAQALNIPNYTSNDKVSLLFANGTAYTEKSSHNAMYDKNKGQTVTDLSSENIKVSVPVEPEIGYVDWISEEKIYNGVINYNDIKDAFIRTQFSSLSAADYERTHTVTSEDTWESIALLYDIEVIDLKVENDEIENLEEGTNLIIPPNIILPELAPEAEFEDDTPYEISIIPDSVFKKNGDKVHESFIPIDWESKNLPLSYEYYSDEEESDSTIYEAELVRGTGKNGMDPLPLSNVKSIISITQGTRRFQPWNETIQVGDYKLNHNYVDWSPAKAGSLEPEEGSTYTVLYRRKEIKSVKVHLDTTYFEQIGTDIAWRSPEVKVYEGVCTPSEDFVMELPKFSEFEGFSTAYKYVDYVIEDNDLWVDTSLQEIDKVSYLVGSLKGKDPSKNWHPAINTGYYYLKEQEYYLYSEPIKTVLEEKELPDVKNLTYVNGNNGLGALLQPKGENLILDSTLTMNEWGASKVLNPQTLPKAGPILGVWRLGVHPFQK